MGTSLFTDIFSTLGQLCKLSNRDKRKSWHRTLLLKINTYVDKASPISLTFDDFWVTNSGVRSLNRGRNLKVRIKQEIYKKILKIYKIYKKAFSCGKKVGDQEYIYYTIKLISNYYWCVFVEMFFFTSRTQRLWLSHSKVAVGLKQSRYHPSSFPAPGFEPTISWSWAVCLNH